MLEPPRSRRGWILLIIAVLLASTVVTAALSAVLTEILFPDGFLVEVPAEADRPKPAVAAAPEKPASGFGLSASISCSVSFGDVGDL